MGYYSRVTGRIAVVPPVPFTALAASRFFPDNRTVMDWLTDVKHEVTESALPGVPGAVQRMVVAIVPVCDGPRKFYDLADELDAAVSEIRAAGSGVQGEFVRTGEEQGDVERYWVSGDCIVREKAELRWPDGSLVGAA